jgi:hypothetical protein
VTIQKAAWIAAPHKKHAARNDTLDCFSPFRASDYQLSFAGLNKKLSIFFKTSYDATR